jgi:hypothetical protein
LQVTVKITARRAAEEPAAAVVLSKNGTFQHNNVVSYPGSEQNVLPHHVPTVQKTQEGRAWEKATGGQEKVKSGEAASARQGRKRRTKEAPEPVPDQPPDPVKDN